MKHWMELVARWLLLLGAYGVLAYFVYLVGVYAVPGLTGFDRSLAEMLNPDQYVPGVDEFFRALTDYSNFLIPVPMVSWMVAYGLLRLTQMPRRRALAWTAVSCTIYWVVLGLLYSKFSNKEGVSTIVTYLMPVAPVLIALGAGVPAIAPKLNPRHWLTGLLGVETFIIFGLWATKHLGWNAGLVGANFVYLPALVLAFGGMMYFFATMQPETMRRFARVFWLVLLSISMTELIATQNTKDAVARPRPLSEKNAPWNEKMRSIPEENLRGANSYPSGHTSGTFALLIPIFWWFRDPRARAGVLAWCILQGVSRVYTAAHFPIDCLMGALLGLTAGSMVFFLLGGPKLRLEKKAVVAERT